jgi:hypothetical protein
MFDAIARLMPAAAKMSRQIVPPVIATLIAAGLISAYNTTFSGHLSQPRMSGLHADEAVASAGTVTSARMTKQPGATTTEVITIYEEAAATERLWDKAGKEEAGKDQAAIKLAEPAPAPLRTASIAKSEPRTEPRRAAALEFTQPVAPATVIAVPPSVGSAPTAPPVIAAMPPAQEQRPPYQPQYRAPPPVIMGSPPVVTVPDRPNARPPEEAQTQPAQPQGAMAKFVNALKPSTWFARAREFGDKIEQAGNDILPSIRQ